MALDRYALAGRIRELLDPELAAIGFELVEVRVYLGGGRLQARIYIDAPGGVDLEGCARASRTVDPLLQESDLVQDRYVIEVSSPGVRRPLRKREHFQQHVGETVEIRGGDAERPWRLRGRLVAVDEAGLTLQPLAALAAAEASGAVEGAEDEEGPGDEPAGADAGVGEAGAGDAAADEAGAGAGAGTGAGEAGAAAVEEPAGPVRVVGFAEILEANLDPAFDPQALIHADRQRRKQERRQERQERQERRERKRRRPRRRGPVGDS